MPGAAHKPCATVPIVSAGLPAPTARSGRGSACHLTAAVGGALTTAGLTRGRARGAVGTTGRRPPIGRQHGRDLLPGEVVRYLGWVARSVGSVADRRDPDLLLA